ncbi:T6SS immunity protein Tdi1 domain-containing protein [Pseudomonas batumici]|uniref:T6SS immunity protein Tdi1 domain-containing protein n=1 Tax=Pseudomonas batumici TaxID=226910 RepID=UPI0030D014E8
MFDRFMKLYSLDGNDGGFFMPSNFSFKCLEQRFDGVLGGSFNGGLYRLHSASEIKLWNHLVSEAFPDYAGRIFCFAYDWLGRQFALDGNRIKNGEPLILMLEPGTGEVLEIPVGFIQFHEEELVNYANEALAVDFFKQWLASGNLAPSRKQSIGYSVPLFLGGADSLENLKCIDSEVYWSMSGQLLKTVRGLPSGTVVDIVSIEK